MEFTPCARHKTFSGGIRKKAVVGLLAAVRLFIGSVHVAVAEGHVFNAHATRARRFLTHAQVFRPN